MPRLAHASLLALTALGSACVVPFGTRDVVVDGVELEEKHTETIEIASWSQSGLEIRSFGGDVHIESTSGPNRIEVTVHEKTLGDASPSYEGGKLLAHTQSGQPYAIGDVQIYANGPLPALDIETGMGDLRVHGVAVQNKLQLSTGLGDVEAFDVGDPLEISVDSGLGSLTIRGASCARLSASTGLGDIQLEDVTATEAEASSGMGDVSVSACRIETVEASTGLGDVDCDDSQLGRHEFESGLGSVRIR